MNGLLAYSGLTTKVRAMEGNLIDSEKYSEIINLSSVTEVITYLGNLSSYKKIFDGVDISLLHRNDLERHLLLSIYDDFGKLYNFASVKQRKYLELYFMRFETHILKQVFREIMDKRDIVTDLSIIKPYFDRFSDINIDKLNAATSLDECFESLKDTKYYIPLIRIRSLGTTSLFDYELALDLLYFETMWNSRKKYLKGTDYKVITETYGYKIDLLNIQWIYRCKKFYNISSAEIYSMLIPVYYKLNVHQVKEMVESENLSTLQAVYSKTFYYKKMLTFENSENSSEKLYKLLLDKLHTVSFKNNPYSLACVDTYLYKKHQEISKLISLTECIRYSYTPAEINALIN